MVAVVVSLCWTLFASHVQAYGVGWCHYFGGANDPHVQYIYPGSSLTWAKVEPRQGQYDFTALDSMIVQARSAGKRLHVQFLVSNPNIDTDHLAVVPQWAVDSGMHVVTTSRGAVTMPIQWDPLYVRYHESLLRAFAARYDKSEYTDVIESVVMQSGGNWGEMALPVTHAANQPGADVLDPENYFVQEIARVYLGSESRSSEIARKVGNNYVFDDYYIRAVKELIDVYARSITRYPFALQLGNGISWQARVAEEPVAYGVGRYGSRMWIRSAGWGSFGMGSDDPATQDTWGRYQDRTVMSYEPGHPSWWCAAEGGYTKGGCFDCCQWATRAEADRHNTNFINMAINSGAVTTCFQSVFFTNPTKYRIDFQSLATRLQSNVERKSHLLAGSVPTSPPTPPPRVSTPTPIQPTDYVSAVTPTSEIARISFGIPPSTVYDTPASTQSTTLPPVQSEGNVEPSPGIQSESIPLQVNRVDPQRVLSGVVPSICRVVRDGGALVDRVIQVPRLVMDYIRMVDSRIQLGVMSLFDKVSREP